MSGTSSAPTQREVDEAVENIGDLLAAQPAGQAEVDNEDLLETINALLESHGKGAEGSGNLAIVETKTKTGSVADRGGRNGSGGRDGDDGDDLTSGVVDDFFSEYFEEEIYDDDEDDYDAVGRHGAYRTPRSTVSSALHRRREPPKTQLPPYPTPYELWRQAHVAEDMSHEPPVLSKKEWGTLVERLNASSRQQKVSLMRKQHEVIANELKGLTFQPKINEKSRRLAAENYSLPERLDHLMRLRKEKLERERSKLAQDVVKEVTASPKINEFSSKILRRNRGSAKRTVDDLEHYGNVQGLRLQQMRQFVLDAEERDCTFQPQLNSRSLRIADKVFAGRHVYDRLYKDGGKRKVKKDPNETFHPEINNRSKTLARNTNVYDRLYWSAKAQNTRAAKAREAKRSVFIKNIARKTTTAVASPGSPGARARKSTVAIAYNPRATVVERENGSNGTGAGGRSALGALSGLGGDKTGSFSDSFSANSPIPLNRSAAQAAMSGVYYGAQHVNTVVFKPSEHGFLIKRFGVERV